MHTVFIIHGMGKHGEDWSAPYTEQIRRDWLQYKKLGTSIPIKSQIHFEELRYDQIFSEYIDKQLTAAKSVDAALAVIGATPGVIAEFTRASTQLTGNPFWQSHLLDVLFWRYFRTMQDAVVAELKAKIVLQRPKSGAFEFSVVAHSLGTAVIHETLNAMALDDYASGLKEPSFSVRALMMVSNVSRVLEMPERDVYKSQVKPAETVRKGICKSYINVKNTLDPIWQPRPFVPQDYWKSPLNDELPRYDVVEFTYLTESLNPHDLKDYLAHPSVHIALFRHLLFRDVIDRTEGNEKITAYSSPLRGKAKEIAQKLETIDKVQEIGGLIKVIGEVAKIIGRAP